MIFVYSGEGQIQENKKARLGKSDKAFGQKTSIVILPMMSCRFLLAGGEPLFLISAVIKI
jgi:hypothetical protein